MKTLKPISIIVAMANNRVIGSDNQLPWHISADLKRFKALTMNHAIIMGRKTYESIGKALPGRQNIVVTRNTEYQAEACDIAHDLAAAIASVEQDRDIFIIGGANIYQQTLPLADYLYLTCVDVECEGDAFFPEWPADEWQQTFSESHAATAKEQYPYRFVDLKRIKIRV